MPTLTFDGAGVTVATPKGDKVILAPTSLELTERRIGVIGANGSGKSTLARMVNGLVTASTGRVLVDGVDVAAQPSRVRRRVGFVFTDPAAQVVMPTCVEDIELSLRRHVKRAGERRERALDVLARYGLRDLADTSVHALSGGQRQLLAIAGVLATEPVVVVADEPTTLLDLANTRRIGDLLHGLDQQVVLVTHDLDLVRHCDRVLVVDHGRVRFDGAADEAVADYVASVEQAVAP
ncbi:ABC transporter ATP-binding protein [Mumia sp. ZJ1417]|uniref:energy-coupling factor ABC transporter ATP-binding protein n=1 Tax=Mumia sp. ZJ1417 TaxID=2708082 RepID=UPI001421EA90|nr:ABC transporter ATP-binding protein [Mumia sp. ZJ1417]QMW66696.1 ABC transporter ATP-binding protein [Mumia sp. ZJ1417]